MRLPGFLDRTITRLFGSFSLDDPRPIHQRAPYTFFLPDPSHIAAVRPGDWVKAIFVPQPRNRYYDAERMWVAVDVVEEHGFDGRLDSEPFDIPQAVLGQRLFIPFTHIIDIDWAEGHEPPPVPETRSYWDRCYADDCILRGASHVDYLYREEPSEMREGDTAPDSGWRFRGTDKAIEADRRQGYDPSYIALGKVLNSDDRWIHLIDEPAGSAFLWDDASGVYQRVED